MNEVIYGAKFWRLADLLVIFLKLFIIYVNNVIFWIILKYMNYVDVMALWKLSIKIDSWVYKIDGTYANGLIIILYYLSIMVLKAFYDKRMCSCKYCLR